MNYQNCTHCAFKTRFPCFLFNHYQLEHAHEPNFSILCGIEGCLSTYNKIPSLKKHIKRKHSVQSNFLLKNHVETSESFLTENELVDESLPLNYQDCSLEENVELKTNYSQTLTKFLLKIREKHGIAENTSAAIIEEYSSLITVCIEVSH